MRELINGILIVVAIGCIALAQVTGIGNVLYDWAHDVPFGLAAWGGFVVWMKMMGLGFLSFIGVVVTND